MSDKTEEVGNPGEMQAFFTRASANQGVKFPLHNAAGALTEHWLLVRGVDSDEFRIADLQAKREAVAHAAIEDLALRDQLMADTTRKLIASLVADWSFTHMPCTRQNVVAFLREAPQIEPAIDRVATRRALFFANASSSSANT